MIFLETYARSGMGCKIEGSRLWWETSKEVTFVQRSILRLRLQRLEIHGKLRNTGHYRKCKDC